MPRRPQKRNDPVPPKGPPAPTDPTKSDPIPVTAKPVTVTVEMPERNCLLRMGFVDGQTLELKQFTFPEMLVPASSGGRTVIHILAGATYKMWFGKDQWGGDTLVESYLLQYRCYNPWRWAPSVGFSPRDSQNQLVLDDAIGNGFTGGCPVYVGSLQDCKTRAFNTLAVRTAFVLSESAVMGVTNGEFRYC